MHEQCANKVKLGSQITVTNKWRRKNEKFYPSLESTEEILHCPQECVIFTDIKCLGLPRGIHNFLVSCSLQSVPRGFLTHVTDQVGSHASCCKLIIFSLRTVLENIHKI